MAKLLDINVGDRVQIYLKSDCGSETGTVLAINEAGVDLYGEEGDGLTILYSDIEEVILL